MRRQDNLTRYSGNGSNVWPLEGTMQNETGKIEQRLMSLEEKVEFQDYTIEKLNDVILAQQKQMDQLEEKMRRFGDQLLVDRLTMEKSGKKIPPLQY